MLVLKINLESKNKQNSYLMSHKFRDTLIFMNNGLNNIMEVVEMWNIERKKPLT